jgi:hypothetical protein
MSILLRWKARPLAANLPFAGSDACGAESNFRSRLSSRSIMARLAGSKVDKAAGAEVHSAPMLSQNEQEGFFWSHLVRRARQTWQAVTALFLGYAELPLLIARALRLDEDPGF